MDFAIELSRFWEAGIRLLYPATCGVCKLVLTLDEAGICVSCGLRLSSLKWAPEERNIAQKFQHLDSAWALYPYESPAKDLLTGIKFFRKRWLLHLFEKEAAQWVLALHAENHYDGLIPIPLGRYRLMHRQFNQAEVLAHKISQTAEIPVKPALRKKRITSPQSALARKDRLNNLRNAFRCPSKKSVKGQTLLLIDDILTTGATADEAARVLKDAGAQKVDLLALAYTLKGNESFSQVNREFRL